MSLTDIIYLDYQATTPMAPEARDAMLPYLNAFYGNPHSAHRMGRAVAAAVENARAEVAALLPPGGRVIFTGSATEAINLAMFGLIGSVARRPPLVVHFEIEHAAVQECGWALDAVQVEVMDLGVPADGVISATNPSEWFPDRLDLLAVMQVNNEIGTIQPVTAMAEAAHARGGYFLCDAVQSYGRMPVPDNADMIAISAHKIHGPKGIGALWVRDGIDLQPLIHGGGQEQGLRSGTLSPALCAGFGAAAKLARERIDQDAAHVEMLWDRATELFADWTVNGSVEHRYKGNLNIRRDGVDVGRLMSECRDIAFSAGSACASGSGRPSHVLRAIGLSDTQAKSSIRLGFGRYSTIEDIEVAAEAINTAAEALL